MRLFPTTRNRKRQAFQVLVASVCVLLILVFGVVPLLHTHDSSEVTSPGCSLCAVAHLSALHVPVPHPAVSIQLTLFLQQSVAAHAPPRFSASPLSNRPPPVLTTHS